MKELPCPNSAFGNGFAACGVFKIGMLRMLIDSYAFEPQ